MTEPVLVRGAAQRAVSALLVEALYDRADLLGVEDIERWIVGIDDRLSFRGHIPAADPAGLTFYCDLDGEPLMSVRARDLVDTDGTPIDAVTLAAELAWQAGAIPDDLSGLL